LKTDIEPLPDCEIQFGAVFCTMHTSPGAPKRAVPMPICFRREKTPLTGVTQRHARPHTAGPLHAMSALRTEIERRIAMR
jgi:hypothetical protein